MQLSGYRLPRIHLLETVWKIAEGVLDRVCAVAQDGEMRLLHPLLPTRATRTGSFPDFPNSLSTVGTWVNKEYWSTH